MQQHKPKINALKYNNWLYVKEITEKKVCWLLYSFWCFLFTYPADIQWFGENVTWVRLSNKKMKKMHEKGNCDEMEGAELEPELGQPEPAEPCAVMRVWQAVKHGEVLWSVAKLIRFVFVNIAALNTETPLLLLNYAQLELDMNTKWPAAKCRCHWNIYWAAHGDMKTSGETFTHSSTHTSRNTTALADITLLQE